MTVVVNLKNSEYDVYIGRAGHGCDGYFGNPFGGLGRTESIAKHREYAIRRYNTDDEFRERVNTLYGKRLGCFCKPKPCHGDVYVELAESGHSPLF